MNYKKIYIIILLITPLLTKKLEANLVKWAVNCGNNKGQNMNGIKY